MGSNALDDMERAPSVTVREFSPSDAKGIIAIHQEFRHWFEDIDLTPAFLAEIAGRHDFSLLVAEHEGRVVGFAGTLYYASVGRAELGPIGIDPVFEGRGIGTLLARKATDILSAAGIHRVVVRVKDGNERAQTFFAKLGFAPEARLERYTKKGESVLQMVRFLNG